MSNEEAPPQESIGDIDRRYIYISECLLPKTSEIFYSISVPEIRSKRAEVDRVLKRIEDLEKREEGMYSKDEAMAVSKDVGAVLRVEEKENDKKLYLQIRVLLQSRMGLLINRLVFESESKAYTAAEMMGTAFFGLMLYQGVGEILIELQKILREESDSPPY
ncbi:MAG: hypothetical protein QF793_03620 [Candidatus Peribacteraceae bacterium]|jgi:hypothetical protein|nr:hypothetical protein [bacterium]MDP6561987.1 hypothetical protein [Candidatus Peribacteraceae bacterium]